MAKEELLSGILKQIIFRNEDNGYTVAKMRVQGESEAITVVGSLGGVELGESIKCKGYWKLDPRFGKQFAVSELEIELPNSPEALVQFLGSGLLPGIGIARAQQIVKKFGKDSLRILEEEPAALLKIPGIGKKALEKIKQAWAEQQDVRKLLLFLQEYGISQNLARRIYREYKREAISRIKANPYRLASEIEGIGFATADELARKLNVAENAPQRLEAALLYQLDEEARKEGHSCLPKNYLLRQAFELLMQEPADIAAALDGLLAKKRLSSFAKEGEEFIQLRIFRDWEASIALRLKVFEQRAVHEQLRKLGQAELDKASEELNIELAVEQEAAIYQCFSQSLHIITGGPGTGKSTLTKVLVQLLKGKDIKYRLAAPTGRAAKRLSEITGAEAQTVHSLLEYEFSSHKQQPFRRNAKNPLDLDLLLVDEASMLDTALLYALWDALPANAACILVGDIDQLPSVGAGHVLRDLLASGKASVTRLTEVFRQAKHSQIIQAAHAFREGIVPEFRNGKSSDCFFLDARSPEEIADLLSNLLARRLPRAYQFQKERDIQVLSPMNKGELGSVELNRIFQQQLRSPQALATAHKRGEMLFAVGDKVIQTRNNYDKDIYNGDLGYIEELHPSKGLARIRFDEKLIDYVFKEFIDLELAYCVSVHKFQGSESPCVLIPVHDSHYKMLYRNLYYTALTRGKQLVIFVGSREALARALQNNRTQLRYTGLLEQLCGEEESSGLPKLRIVPPLGSDNYEAELDKLYKDLY